MIKESVVLPSLGHPYRGRLHGNSITVSPMTTRIYKDFIWKNNEEGLLNLVDSCLVDCPIKAESLCFADLLAVYIKIRTISIGSTVPHSSTCPVCGSTQFSDWDLNKLTCNYLGIDTYPIPVELPETKTQITIEIPSTLSDRLAKEEAQRRATRFNNSVSEYQDLYTMLICIDTQPSMDLVSRAEWYESLPLRDAMFLEQAFQMVQEFGLETKHRVICKSCSHSYTVPLRIDRDFFRPRIGSIEGFTTKKGTLEEGPTDTTPHE